MGKFWRSLALAVLIGLSALPIVAKAATLRPDGSTVLGPVASDEALDFRIFLPARDPDGLAGFATRVSTPGDALYHHFLTPAEVALRFGPASTSLDALEAAARRAGFQVIERDAHGIRVIGAAGQVEAFIGTKLDHVQTPQGNVLVGARTALHLPTELNALGAKIFAFAGTIHMHDGARQVPLEQTTAGTGPFLTSDLKQAYDAPSYQSLTGAGATIAILISGSVASSDIQANFAAIGVAAPSFTVEPVDGGSTTSSFEATLDVTQAGGFAPGAALIQYQVPDLSEQSVIDALNQIVTDNKADIVSMSFGGCELFFLAFWEVPYSQVDTLLYEDEFFQQGVAQGITFVASSGDSGGLACPPAGSGSGTVPSSGSWVAGVINPAASPNVTAVGGTNLMVTANSPDSTYASENADYDPMPQGSSTLTNNVWGSGGGYSVMFPQPSYQQLVKTGVSARTVPDLALHMGGCPDGGCSGIRSFDYLIYQGKEVGAVGTSASAPDFAGVMALIKQHTGSRQGRYNDTIYALAKAQAAGGAAVFHQDIAGNNAVYTSSATGSPAYNMVIGNGTLDIRKFMGVTNLPAAGTPGSPSNP